MHLYTYDLFAERTGFKLFWGCTVFYPFFYCIGVWPLLRSAAYDDISVLAASAAVGLYVSGWIMTRGANLQKFYMKVCPCVRALGPMREPCARATARATAPCTPTSLSAAAPRRCDVHHAACLPLHQPSPAPAHAALRATAPRRRWRVQRFPECKTCFFGTVSQKTVRRAPPWGGSTRLVWRRGAAGARQ